MTHYTTFLKQINFVLQYKIHTQHKLCHGNKGNIFVKAYKNSTEQIGQL